MLDLMGSGYVIEHAASAALTRDRVESFMVYVTDCLRATIMGLGAKNVKRWADIIHPPKTDNRSAQDIAADVTARLGLKVVNKHERNDPDGDAGS